VRFVAYAGCVDGSVGGYGKRSNLTARRFIEHVAFALFVYAINEARAIGAGNQIAFCIPGQGADVRFIGLEEEFRLAAGFEGSTR